MTIFLYYKITFDLAISKNFDVLKYVSPHLIVKSCETHLLLLLFIHPSSVYVSVHSQPFLIKSFMSFSIHSEFSITVV